MAAGYLDLLRRELRDAVVHPFPSVAVLAGYPGDDGQIASVGGAFYICSKGVWRKVADEIDLALIHAELGRSAAMYSVALPEGAVSPFPVLHGFAERPQVEVTGPDGSVIFVEVVHSQTEGSCEIRWHGSLPSPAVVTCVGKPAGDGLGDG